MARERALTLRIAADAAQARRELAGLDKAAGKHGKGTEKALSGVKGALLDIGVAGVGLFAFSEWNDAQKVAGQTAAVLKSTGNAANTTADDMSALAEAISEKTGIDDEAIQAGANWLATFKNVRNEAGKGNDIFDRTTETMVDLSVAMGTDAKGAAGLLGKALNDPIKGVGQLSRAGVTFTAQQKESIKTLVETGDLLGAQKLILAEVESQVKGSAEAQATGYDKARVAAGNLAETAGGILAPAVEAAASAAQTGAEWFQDLEGWQQKLTLGAGAGAYAWLRWSDEIKAGFGAARGGIATAKELAGAIDDIAASRGVSRTTAAFEVLKESMVGADSRSASLLNTFASYPTSMGLAAGGVAALGIALWDMAEDADRAKRNAQDLLDVADRTGATLEDAFTEKLAKTIADVSGGFDLGNAGDTFGRDVKNIGVSLGDLQKGLTGTQREYDALRNRFADSELGRAYLESLDSLRAASEDASSKQEKLTNTNKALGLVVDETTGEVAGMSGALDESGEAATRSSEPFVLYADRVEKARRATVDFYTEQFEQANASIGAEADLDRLTQSLAENGRTLDENTEQGRSNKQALIDYVTAAAQASVGTDDAASSMKAYTMRLAESMLAAGFTKDEVDFMVASMNLTPEQIDTRFTSNATEETDRVGGYINKIMGVPSVWYTDFIARGGVGNIQGILGFANGGNPPVGRPSIVGERGPEIIVPRGPSTVIPNHKIGGMVGGDTVVVVNLDGREVARHVASTTNRATRSQGRSPLVSTISSLA